MRQPKQILIGQEIHEWLGASMFVLFVMNQILNFGWWKIFAKGKYTPSLAFGVAPDLHVGPFWAAHGAVLRDWEKTVSYR